MIKEIELINFKSHKKTELKFTNGNNIFVGISGAGKSTVLDAICFAFFGTMPKIQKKKVKLSDLIMDKPVKEDLAKITLRFEINNKNYEIKREIFSNKPSSAELREDGKLIAVNQSQVTEAVEKILKIDYDLFSKIIYAEQNQIDYFLTIPPGNRMSNIDELLKLSKFEIARTKTISISNRFKNLKNMKEEVIANLNEQEIRDKKSELEDYLNKAKDEEILLEEKIRRTKTTLNNKEELFNEFERNKTKLENKKAKLIEIKSAINLLQNEIREVKLEDIKKIEKELKDKKLKLENLEKEKLEREKEISSLNSKIEELEKNLKEKKEAEKFLLSFNKERYDSLKEEIEELKEELFNKKLRKQQYEDAILSLKESKEKCPTCDRELTEEKRKELIDRKEKESYFLSKEISELDKKLSNKKEEIELENKKIEKANFLKKRLEQLKNVESDLDNLKKELEKLKQKEIDLSGLKEEVQKLKTHYEKLKLIEIKKQKLEAYKQEQTKIETEIRTISFDESEFEKLKKEVEELKKNLLTFELNLKHIREIKNEKEKSLEQIEKELEFLERNKKEILFLDYANTTLTNFANTLIEVQEILRQEFVKTLNEVMNEIWSYIYPYEDYIGIRFKIENRDYLLQLCDLKNKWINVEGFSSGGERAIASLVMRIALSVVLAPNLRLLVLDEPTHNLDANTIRNLTEILRTKITDLLEQTFIVTHDERLIQAGTGCVYEFKREFGKKEPTKVIELNM
ncbi:MAG: hypothetical protein DRP10_02140 [Candidatus Aenigmatarchaeota archaeon]|nr:MAG: hypothetical protein DRP10_02140 [Candidatus Aenigmarchaeota archaeon]